jgi:ATP-dependent Lon protease
MSEVELILEEDLEGEASPLKIALEGEEQDTEAPIPEELAILPLRDSVVYPMLIAPLSVGREAGIRLIDDTANTPPRMIGVVAQRESTADEPGFGDVFEIGCVVVIRTLMKSPEATRMIIQGTARFRVIEQIQSRPYMKAKIEVLKDPVIPEELEEEVEALKRSIASLFDSAVRLAPNIPDELRGLTGSISEPSVMTDLVTAHMPFSTAQKQQILETVDLITRMKLLLQFLGREVRVLELTSKVHNEVNAELSKSQRDYYLREQLKAIQRELGDEDEGSEDLDHLRSQLEAASLPEEAKKQAAREFSRLTRISPGSPEYTVARTYLETMASLPWTQESTDQLDLPHARIVLDEDHSGLEKIKQRIIEFLAVRKVKGSGPVRQPILCFYGPPGVGKTSLGRSIARAMGRKFVRISLGGMRDEAEIRGHRRTYIGALPGQIIQGLRRAETRNPVFVLDEIDKLGMDFRGDPASALLEVLDPEQNNSFRDHYVDTPFDLSNVFFITTANRMDTIPPPLRDRMEIIELGGYTEPEKLEIARRHLGPKQIEEHGLRKGQVAISDDAYQSLIRHYTREAGVRNLNREIGTVVRKAALKFAEGRKSKLTINEKFVQEAMGAPRFLSDPVTERELMPGMAVGLAWTPVGGEVLFIETVKMPGKKGMTVTGQLGDVMKESVTAAMSWVRSHAAELGISHESIEEHDVHLHIPSGSVPKDGPSAGITIMTALVSLFTGRRVKSRLAMTGEMTLTGQVTAIGGVKEKVLAAHRAGVTHLILSEENRKDYLEEVPPEIRRQLEATFVKRASQVLEAALEPY